MKCFASPTTSNVPENRPCAAPAERRNVGTGQANDAATRQIATQFEALLTKAAFAPLSQALGFYGDLVVGDVALSLAREQRGGLTDRIVALLDAATPARGAAR